MRNTKAKVLTGLVIVILISAPIFSYEVIERFRLGAQVTGITYINSGPLEGKIALLDGSFVYIHDPALGNYEKIFSTSRAWLNGITYLSQGPFAENFLLSGGSPQLFLFTTTGSPVGTVAQDFSWGWAEGLTQITSGPDKGMIALINASSWPPHIIIFDLQQSGTEIQAVFERDIPLDFHPAPYYAMGIAWLPDDFPDPSYRGMFVVSDQASESIYVIDDYGNCIVGFPGVPSDCEGLTYFSSGAYRGKLFLSDWSLLNACIRSLDGEFSETSSLPPVGLGIEYINYNPGPLTWLKDREQLFINCIDDYYDMPVDLISRWSAGVWHWDERLRIPYFWYPRSITELTADGTYKLFGYVSSWPRRLGVASLDAALNWMGDITPLPEEYNGTPFRTLVYVAGDTPDADRFVVPSGKNIYSFYPSFQIGEIIADLSEVLTGSVSNGCYDPAARRFYLWDQSSPDPSGGWFPILRVFDADWNIIDSFVIEDANSGVTKITSGELRGCIAVQNTDDNEVIILNVEYDLAAALIGRLIGDIQTTELKKGLAKSLISKLEDALGSIAKKHARPAVNQLEEFIDAVYAQSGKGIPAAAAEGWMALAQNVISGLQELL